MCHYRKGADNLTGRGSPLERLRLLEEKAEMACKLKEYALGRNFKSAPKRFEEQAKKHEANAVNGRRTNVRHPFQPYRGRR
jgi:hypothetical protein